MKLIDTKTHGYMDYSMGILLLIAPSAFSLERGTPESTVLYALGVVVFFYSLLTNYELGLVKIFPMKFHLFLDFLSGVFLAASPWLLGFADRIYIPHLVLGIIEIGAVLITRTQRNDN